MTDFIFEDFTSATIPQWEEILKESFGQEGPGHELYTESDEFKHLMDIKIFNKKRPDIVSGFQLLEAADQSSEDLINLAFTETIFELQLSDVVIDKMNQWL